MRDDASAAARRLGGGPRSGWTADERLAWARWAPIVLRLGRIEGWSAPERKAAIETIRAKGGPRDDAYLARLDAHPKLATALRRLATGVYGR